MPSIVNYESVVYNPTKRRKLRLDLKMAKRPDVEEKAPLQGGNEDNARLEAGCEAPSSTEQPAIVPQSEIQTSDRDELIQCIKRGQRPTWVPKAGLKALYAEEEVLQVRRNAQNDQDHDHDRPLSPTSTSFPIDDDLLFDSWNGEPESPGPSRPTLSRSNTDDDVPPSPTSSIRHRGPHFQIEESNFSPSYSPPSWFEGSSFPLVGQAISGPRLAHAMAAVRTNRPRAPSLSSSFVMRVPTSPLVNAVNNPQLDFSTRVDSSEIDSEDRSGRRKTLPPSSFQSILASSTEPATPNFSRPLSHPPLRRESSFPLQAHQPRKSIGSFTFQPGLGLPSPQSSSRRCSLAIDGSPKRRTSMVGSFEESIVRGRMSSPASKPFDFVASIGVMGKGDCPASLKCPAHVSVPFQAVFYSYPSSQNLRSVSDDTPSPYVGTIDIEHGLKTVQLATRRPRAATLGSEGDMDPMFSSSDPRNPENTPIGRALAREAQLQNELQQSPKPATRMNIGGAYRVPQQGQLQVIIKNSNNIAVKLFLVPYDLTGMEAGTKTFVRQKSYSCGPIVEGALSDKAQQPTIHDPLKDKQILKYLIHLKFCCPGKGKFYLYNNIRVVFANRVPDGKEKLKSDVQLPEPRYSPWKPVKTHQRSASSSIDLSPMATSTRNASSPNIFDDLHTIRFREPESIPEEETTAPEPKITFHIPDMSGKSSLVGNAASQIKTPFVFPDIPPSKDEPPRQPERAVSQVQGFFASTSPRSSPVPWGSSSSSTIRSFSPAPVEAGNGLLSRQFRELHGSVGGSGGSATERDRESVSDPWATTASLTKILSREGTPEQSRQD